MTTENQLVSVIIPFYNARTTIERMLTAIVEQTYTNLEIICVDDGSEDDGAKLVEDFAERDGRVRLIRKQNTGVSNTRNVGLAAANGEWIYFADADDWIVGNAIETFVKHANLSGSELAISDFYRVSKGMVAHKHGPATGAFPMRQFLRYMGRRPADHYYASLWNKLFKHSILEEQGLCFDSSIRFGEDHVFILNYLRHVERVVLIDQPLYYYIDNQGSLIHRGLNPVGIAKMKWDTYRPYRQLCKDSGQFPGARGALRVSKFIVMPAMDHFVDQGDEPIDRRYIFDMIKGKLPFGEGDDDASRS